MTRNHKLDNPEVELIRIQELDFVMTIDENDEDMAELRRLVDQYELSPGVRLS